MTSIIITSKCVCHKTNWSTLLNVRRHRLILVYYTLFDYYLAPKFKVMKDGLMIYNVTKEDAKKSYACHAMDIDSPMPDAKLMNIALHVTSMFKQLY